MKGNTISSLLLIFVLWLIIFASFSVEAKRHHKNKSKIHKHNIQKNGDDVDNSPAPGQPGAYPLQSAVFNILSFGAKGNGASDDSKALLAAWKSACKVTGAVIEIPSKKFLIKPIILQGPCMPNLVLQIDGTIFAPPEVRSWPRSSLYQWIDFKWLSNFTIRGSGIVDGRGSNWWSSSQINPLRNKRSKVIPDMKPTALRFYTSYNVTVRDIRIVDSPLCHLKFDNSEGVKIDNITISAPENSPNTDGIHLQNTKDVEIHHSNISCGDDCVSIQTGCSNVRVHHINCGPGHGISLGGLGKDKSIACVSDIIVENIVMTNTLYGARIKTWQGGIGSVKNVTFSNIKLSEVKVPIMIDQYYCDKNVCKNQTGAVTISGVKFDRIIGTYSAQPVHIACSDSIPCVDVDLVDIQLKPSPRSEGIHQALCWNSYGKSQAPLVPSSMDYCVRSGNDLIKRISRSYEGRC